MTYIINTAIILISLGLYSLTGSFDPRGKYSGVNDPAFWPRVLLIFIIVVAVVSMAVATFGRKSGGKEEKDLPGIFFGKLVAAFCLAVLYAIGMQYFGFILSTLLFQLLFLLLQGVRKPLTLIITPLILTTMVYLIFVVVMSIPLPRGVGIFRSFSLLFY